MNQTLRIATWNLARPKSAESTRAKRLLEHIQRENADVWILTETHTDVSPGPGYEVRASAGSDREQEDGEVWTAIWSRFPILRELKVSDPIRSVCVEVKTPVGGLIVYGTVLPWLSDERFDPLRGAAAFTSELAKNAEDWRRIQSENPQCGVCVAGDFNQDLSETHYYGSAVGRAALRKTLEENRLTCLTSNALDRVNELTEGRCSAIDHICLCESWATRFRGLSNVWPREFERTSSLSDHFGVWVDLQVT